MDVWEVFSRRTNDDPLVYVGSISAPDLEMALVLARETFFRHGEGVDCWVGRRGDLHRVAHPETLGGVIDKSYRRPDGYVGVGAKLKRVTKEMSERGMAVDGARPGAAEAPR